MKLYHGTNRKLKILEPKKPAYDLKENSMKAVFATDNKKLALAMALTCQKGSESFGSHDCVKINFVKSYPKMKYVYLYYLNSKDFVKNKRREYISIKKIIPIKVERYKVSELNSLWRKSNKKELKDFLKNREKWRTPK